MSLKLDDFVKPCKGRGDSFEEFWEKFEVLADVAGWDTDEKKMKRLPLFFEGLSCLLQDGGKRQGRQGRQGQSRLAHAQVFQCYAQRSLPYRQFKSRKLLVDETPEAYLADLRRMLALAGP